MTIREPAEGLLVAAEAASRLGVHPTTLYAYVSRGFLHPQRVPGERFSLYAVSEIEELARRSRRRRAFGASSRDEISHISGTKLSYRERDACQLARSMRFEQVAEWLWTGRAEEGGPWRPNPRLVEAARQILGAVADGAAASDRLPLIVQAAALADPLRLDTTERAVLATSRALIATMVAALPPSGAPEADSLAEQLWARLTVAPPTPGLLETLNASLVLLADHGARPAATRAAILAASAGSDPYAVLLAAMAVGSKSQLGRPFLNWQNAFGEISGPDAGLGVIADRLRRGERVPGFQRRQYEGPDPRAVLLFELLQEHLAGSASLAGILALIDVIRERQGLEPNVEVAVAAFAVLADMSPDAGEVIFTVARSAGWLAHAMQTYRAGPVVPMPSFMEG